MTRHGVIATKLSAWLAAVLAAPAAPFLTASDAAASPFEGDQYCGACQFFNGTGSEPATV
jgi:hypothetical protein